MMMKTQGKACEIPRAESLMVPRLFVACRFRKDQSHDLSECVDLFID